jgi:cytochrome P450
MTSLRSRIVTWVGKWYLHRARRKGLDLSLIPDKSLMPLRRVGLDPIPELGRLRERAPVSRLTLPFGIRAWLVTGYDEVKAVLGQPAGFSNDFTNLVGSAGLTEQDDPGGLGFSDPPLHTTLRRALTPEFTVRRLARLQPVITGIVEDLLDQMAAQDGPVDLARAFALPIPSLTICALLGVPYEDREDFQRLSTARFDLLGGAAASFGAVSESLTYLLDMVAAQRESPGDGLLGMLVKQHGDTLTDRQLAGLADGLLTGGLETTASMLALGALVLLREPELAARLRDDDEAVGPFVDELLRYLTVVQVAFPRFARTDVEIGGIRILKGDIVFCSLSAANRDSPMGAGPETFHAGRYEPGTPVPGHLAFGYGIHRCLGAELAKMELRIAYPALVRRFPEMRAAVAQEELSFRGTSVVYGVETVPVLLS